MNTEVINIKGLQETVSQSAFDIASTRKGSDSCMQVHGPHASLKSQELLMKIGYLRVSTKDQCEDRQRDALLPICDELRVEKLSSVAKVRPVYERVVANRKPGDTFVVWDLNRAWRSAKDALNELHAMRARGVEVQIASMNLDTTTPIGKLMFTFISGLAEFERDLHVTRTKQGLDAARKRGKRIGRPPKVSNRQIRTAQQKLAAGGATINELAALNGVHPWTLRRRISALEEDTAS